MSVSRVCYRLLSCRLNYRVLGSLKRVPRWTAGFSLEGGHQRRLCTAGSAVFQQSSNNEGQKKTSTTSTPANQPVSFATLFRNSPLVQLGPPEGKVVVGSVVDVVGDDLYIDFGFKFTAVCRRPKVNPENYFRGSTVKVRINDLELSDRFLGSTQDMTLLEADVTLLGLVTSTTSNKTSSSEASSI